MKYCPVCQTRYDEEVIKFCTKDGAPLVEENPSFTAMPSESLSAEDFDGEETIIRRNPPSVQSSEQIKNSSQRIVIPTNETSSEAVRAKTQPAYQPPPKSNTAVTVLLTLIGTLAVLGGLGGLWYLLRSNNTTDANKNSNVNFNNASNVANFNTNFNTTVAPVNYNVNANSNANTNVNTNANLKTPTPTRTPTPTPTATPENSNANANQNNNLNLGNTNVMSRPTATPTPTPSPKPASTPSSPTPSNVNVGVMNSRAVSLTTPAYPQSARAVNAGGEVRVQISVDEAGNVTSAKAVSGHPLLRPSAEAAARQSRFNPIRVGDRPVSANGILVYNFINQ